MFTDLTELSKYFPDISVAFCKWLSYTVSSLEEFYFMKRKGSFFHGILSPCKNCPDRLWHDKRNLPDKLLQNYKILEVVGCSDLLPERSAARAREFGIRQMTNEGIFTDPEIELVINTTYPLSHYPVSKAALLAGKNVYSEKMLSVNFSQGEELVRLAQEKELLLGCAPDTFMGAALQTARRVIDSGFIGTPVAATAVLGRCYHHERWKSEANAVLPSVKEAVSSMTWADIISAV